MNVNVTQRPHYSECTVRGLVWEILFFNAGDVVIDILNVQSTHTGAQSKVIWRSAVLVCAVCAAPSVNTEGAWLP